VTAACHGGLLSIEASVRSATLLNRSAMVDDALSPHSQITRGTGRLSESIQPAVTFSLDSANPTSSSPREASPRNRAFLSRRDSSAYSCSAYHGSRVCSPRSRRSRPAIDPAHLASLGLSALHCTRFGGGAGGGSGSVGGGISVGVGLGGGLDACLSPLSSDLFLSRELSGIESSVDSETSDTSVATDWDGDITPSVAGDLSDASVASHTSHASSVCRGSKRFHSIPAMPTRRAASIFHVPFLSAPALSESLQSGRVARASPESSNSRQGADSHDTALVMSSGPAASRLGPFRHTRSPPRQRLRRSELLIARSKLTSRARRWRRHRRRLVHRRLRRSFSAVRRFLRYCHRTFFSAPARRRYARALRSAASFCRRLSVRLLMFASFVHLCGAELPDASPVKAISDWTKSAPGLSWLSLQSISGASVAFFLAAIWMTAAADCFRM
jgi:hypothetical protein